MSEKRNSITEGNIIISLIIFALPLLGGSLIQQLYNTADMIFAGRFVSKEAAAAVGASGLLFTCVIGLLTGISVGVGILISHKTGAKDYEGIHNTVKTSIFFGTISGIVLTAGGLIFSEKLLTVMNTPSEIMDESVLYLKIYFLSMIPMILYNMGSGIIRSSGNSKLPFCILVAGGLLNIISNAVFVIIFGMGVAGVAIATLISQGITAILTVIFLFKENFLNLSDLKSFNLDFHILSKIIHYGLPAGIQSMIITFSNIVVQFYINGYGSDAVAAYASYFKLENFIWLPIVSIGQAITTFTAQNTGARNYERIRKGTLVATFLSIGVTAILTGIILTFSEISLEIFIKDVEVIALGKKIIFITFPFYWLYSILETFGGSVRGMGYSLTSMSIIIGSLCIMRIFLLMGLSRLDTGFQGIALVYPVTWFTAAILFVLVFMKRVTPNYS